MIKCNYVINLDRRSDRWNEFLKNQESTCLKNDKFIRFSAFDGLKYEEELKRFNVENHVIVRFLKKAKLIVPKGVFGCLMSHMLVLHEIMNNKEINDDDFVGIYEEDFCFSNNFDERYTEFKNIDLNKYGIEFLYLGGRFGPDFNITDKPDPRNNQMFEKTEHPNILFRKNMIYRNFNWDRGAFSFVIRKSICKKLIDIISSSFVKNESGMIQFEAVDYIYTNSFNKVKMFDYLPHLYYSRVNFNSDIQGNHLKNLIQF